LRFSLKGVIPLDRRKNFYDTLNHIQPDDIVMDLGGCPLSTMMGNSLYTLMDYLGFQAPEKPQGGPLRWGQVERLPEELLNFLDIDTRGVGAVQIPLRSQYRTVSENEYVDEWGIRRRFTGLYWDIVESPLRGAALEDLEKFDWPEPESMDMQKLEAEADAAKRLYRETDYVVCADLPVYGIFELGCWMCGFDDFLIKIALDEDFVKSFFEIVLDYQKKVIDIYYGALGPYIHYTASGDDFATQNSLFISRDMFSRLVKPYFKERIAYTRKYTDAAFLHHTCGSVYRLIDELIDCGVEILNPVQPRTADMEPERLKEKFGDRVVFHGGLDIQDILPFGSRETIEAGVKDIIGKLFANGGYIFAAAHNIQEDIPPENIVTMFEAARKYGKKK